MKITETLEHSRYNTQDKIVDGVIVVCIFGVIYGLLWALEF